MLLGQHSPSSFFSEHGSLRRARGAARAKIVLFALWCRRAAVPPPSRPTELLNAMSEFATFGAGCFWSVEVRISAGAIFESNSPIIQLQPSLCSQSHQQHVIIYTCSFYCGAPRRPAAGLHFVRNGQ